MQEMADARAARYGSQSPPSTKPSTEPRAKGLPDEVAQKVFRLKEKAVAKAREDAAERMPRKVFVNPPMGSPTSRSPKKS